MSEMVFPIKQQWMDSNDGHGPYIMAPDGEFGLTKRELFAAMAMQGLVADLFGTHPAEASELAVEHADALIAELEKK